MTREAIAVIGSACRFAGDVDSPSKLWDLLTEPRDLRQEVPRDRFDPEGFYHCSHAYHGHTNVKQSYLLAQDPAAFDAEFFGINPIEAQSIDPQQRLTMEMVYEAIEAAGLTIEGLSGSNTCVYAGVMTGDYEQMLCRDLDQLPTYAAIGTSRAVLSNRVSYFFNWKGASITMDTACSSSLVALHSAIQTLRSGDSDAAVVCGTNLLLGPELYIIESTLKMLSPEGLSRMWDAEANGYARGEGVAALVIKPLSAALRDNDHIECIVRETGVNQDGSTAGLTMPSPTSQRDLIRKTYSRAGLNLNIMRDRPQYFEAHGTGTPAGDPVEAEAVHSAFFPSQDLCSAAAEVDPLYVGSIKTVLGHTEGTAGIAAVLKAMLAVRNSRIPPNLHFNNLSPTVAPFYKYLEVPRACTEWPRLAPDQVRRASVNSFGFGGCNSHAIIESYGDDRPTSPKNVQITQRVFGPFVFSAASEKALRRNLAAYVDVLNSHKDVNAHDLAYTLRERRSILQHRLAVSAQDVATLSEKLTAYVLEDDGMDGPRLVRTRQKAENGKAKLLGVFTGQGAQWSAMGAELIRCSPFAGQIIKGLESYLLELPDKDRPSWSLENELLAGDDTSRLSEGSMSQPLCTAIQIMLVDLLDTANVHFDVVVGHSSGEIAAAYAAGLLSARDAILIAYYRGLSCQYAHSPNGEVDGAMLAAGTSMEDALELCQDETFAGRITLAAVNSSSSVTISGDVDAIEELAIIMEDENKFCRRLRVDKAYHSQHMRFCAKEYADGMQRAGVLAEAAPLISRTGSCQWYSSVYGGELIDSSFGLSGEYWLQNLVRPVMFEAALSAALKTSGSPFDAALEIGPHPALTSPATQIMKDILPKPVPYHGTLRRGIEAVGALSEALGFLWSHLGKRAIDLDHYERKMLDNDDAAFSLLKGLPRYQWNHETRYWSESMRSRHLRMRSQPVHPLLGHPTPESGPHALRWKHVLKPSEMQWLPGHAVQRQIVFPAAGYISTAVEAARNLAADDRSIQAIELSQLDIHQAIPFQDDDDGVEVLVELLQIAGPSGNQHDIASYFSYSAALGGPSGNPGMSLVATANVRVRFGAPIKNLLLERQQEPPHMIEVQPHRLYDDLARLEYNFSGPFRSLVQLRRKLGFSRCAGQQADRAPDCGGLWIHPADLDAAFQAVNLAYSYPGDEQLRHLHLPTKIATIRINPATLGLLGDADDHDTGGQFSVDASWNRPDPLCPSTGFSGNARLYLSGDRPQYASVQVDDVVLKPVGKSEDERKMFCGIDNVPTDLDGNAAGEEIPVTEYMQDFMRVLSRVFTFYAAQFDHDVPADSPARTEEGPNKHYLHYCHHVAEELKKGGNELIKAEWLRDTEQDILDDIHRLGPEAENSADVKLSLLIGRTMPSVFRGEADMLEEMRQSGLLNDFYKNGAGLKHATLWICAILKQLTNRYPHLRLLEVGAGTGSATEDILNSIGGSFNEYTYTDISASFFDHAIEYFAPWKDRMIFKTCNVETDPVEQGFTEGTYDVIIASQVLHVTSDLTKTVRNIRRLLKPGGYLLMGEGHDSGRMHHGGSFLFGALPQWWSGVQDGRVLSPYISVSRWDEILRATGFGGIETMNPPKIDKVYGCAAMVAQALDDRIAIAKTPLASPDYLELDEVHIIGGLTESVLPVVQELQQIMADLGACAHLYRSIEDMDDRVDSPGAAVISLADVDDPVFRDMTPSRWRQFRNLFVGSKSVLWLTCGRANGQAYHNMTVGFGRVALNEETELRVQYLDIDNVSQLDARAIAEAFVCFTNTRLSDGSNAGDLLYTIEREIVIDEQGRTRVPRLGHLTPADDRLHSTQRAVTEDVNIDEEEVAFEQNASGRYLRLLSRFDKAELQETEHEIVELRTGSTILSAMRTPMGFRSLVLGTDKEKTRFLALTSSITSVLRVPKFTVVQATKDSRSDIELISFVATQLLTLAIFDSACTGQRFLVHNASASIAESIVAEASNRNVRVTFTSDKLDAPEFWDTSKAPWFRLNPYAGARDLKSVLDVNIACFVDLSRDHDILSDTLVSIFSSYCRKESFQTLCSASADRDSCIESYGDTSRQLLLRALASNLVSQHTSDLRESIALSETLSANISESRHHPLTVVDWRISASVPARVCRYDIVPLFKRDKTYWLCGLSGALGISLCDWMIYRGVRHLVISSRNPRVDERWVEDHRTNGVVIRVMSCDVTDEVALHKVYQNIVQILPPIAGVISAAMVLRDVSVRNMEYEQLRDVIGPKVLGTIHLDRIFYDINLDFFIVLSSTNCILGNPGQANYAAANMGMAGVVAERRHRGLRASTAHIGAIIGVGYVTDSIERLELVVSALHLIHVSEEEVHQMIAEVFEAGFEDSSGCSEIIMGIEEVPVDGDSVPKWFTDAKFARLLLHSPAGASGKGQDGAADDTIQEILQACKTNQEVNRTIRQAFAAQMRKILYIRLAEDEIMESRSSDLGLDSLIAVDIRSWILKAFNVNIPVLQIMSADARILDIVTTIEQSLPAEMTPLLVRVQEDNGRRTPETGTDNSNADSPRPDTNATTPESASLTKETETSGFDFNIEAQAPVSVVQPPNAVVPRKRPEVILLTGATGLLGHHLLDALRKQDSVRKVICIAIRRLTQRLTTGDLPPECEGIEYHEGDLAVRQFGLGDSRLAEIFDEIDAVVHNGADTSHMKSYSTVREANVESTRQLIRLCAPRKIPLHYISSAGMALASDLDPFPSVAANRSAEVLSRYDASGYMCSKWVCERMLEDAHAQYDLPVWIQRPSSIVRKGQDALTDRAGFDWVNTLIQYSHKIQAVPWITNNQGAFDLVYVQTCCDDVVSGVLAYDPQSVNQITYQNNVGDAVIPMARLNEIAFSEGLQEPYTVLAWEQWLAKAMAAGLHPAVAALIETCDQPGGPSFPALLRTADVDEK